MNNSVPVSLGDDLTFTLRSVMTADLWLTSFDFIVEPKVKVIAETDIAATENQKASRLTLKVLDNRNNPNRNRKEKKVMMLNIPQKLIDFELIICFIQRRNPPSGNETTLSTISVRASSRLYRTSSSLGANFFARS